MAARKVPHQGWVHLVPHPLSHDSGLLVNEFTGETARLESKFKLAFSAAGWGYLYADGETTWLKEFEKTQAAASEAAQSFKADMTLADMLPKSMRPPEGAASSSSSGAKKKIPAGVKVDDVQKYLPVRKGTYSFTSATEGRVRVFMLGPAGERRSTSASFAEHGHRKAVHMVLAWAWSEETTQHGTPCPYEL
mmetsp:Transcript_35831/g.111849  ORF Transcript_35831/g.111849 Transcript_35831/m.111849 type:complete len:192 (+) Transcript_35831:38-613(+)